MPRSPATRSPCTAAVSARTEPGVRPPGPGVEARPRGVRVLLDPAEDGLCPKTLNGRHDLDLGVAVVHPSPHVTSMSLAEDVLVAFGKRPRAVNGEDAGRRGWDLVHLWACAERVQHLVVLRADRLPASQLAELADLVRATDATLWLVAAHRLNAVQRAVLGAPTAMSPCGASLPWRDALCDLPAAPAVVAFPAVPDSDFLSFRAFARRLLEPSAFARLDEVYRSTFHAARAAVRTCWRKPQPWLGAHAPPAGWDRALAEAAVQRLTVTAAGPAELTTRLHAIRAAFFGQGLYLDLPPGTLTEQMAAHLPRSHTVLTIRLRTLRGPDTAGALAVLLATGMNPDELYRIRPSDLTEGQDGALGLRLDGADYRLPGAYAAALRAALAHSQAAGQPEGPVFPPRSRPGRALLAAAQRAGAWVGTDLPAPLRCQRIHDLRNGPP